MNTIMYAITEETYLLPDGRAEGSRLAYGIAAYADWETTGTASVVASMHDICEDKERLMSLVCECNRLQLSPIHLQEVIEDFLAQ